MSQKPEQELSLDDVDFEPISPPKVVGEFTPEQVDQRVGVKNRSGRYGSTQISQEVMNNLDQQVEEVIQIIESSDAHSKEMKDITATLNALGNADIERVSTMSSGMLNRRSLRAMKNDEETGGAEVAKGLGMLRDKMESLDPKRRQGLFKRSRLLGMLPFGMGKKVDSYFKEYKTAEGQLQEIVKTLHNGKDRLIEDNAYIDEDREKMYNLMQHLEQYAYIIKRVDERVEERLPDIEATDKIKADDIRQEILFPIRQKRMDILQQLAVSLQGYLALQVVKKNNVELIAGVDRATKTTMSALRTAVMVSEALGAQKLVLESVQSVNEYTNTIIAQNAEMLGSQASMIQKQASESMLNAEVLEKAFTNIFKAMDQMDKYREEALPSMQKTIGSLEKTLEGAKNYMQTRRQERIGDFTSEVMTESKEDPVKSNAVKIKM